MRVTIYLLLQGIGFCISLDPHFDIPEDWIDPSDMATFDYGTKTNKGRGNFQNERTVSVEEEPTPPPTTEHKENIQDVQEPIRTEQVVPTGNTVKGSDEIKCEQPFLRRFIAVLQNQLESVGSPPRVENYEVSVHLNSRAWLSLQEFTEECSGADNAVRVLEDMVASVHVRLDEESVWKRKFEDFVHISFEDCMKLGVSALLIVSILCMEFWSRISWSTQIKRLLIIAFFISLGMTYFHELKLAEAEYKSKATDVPSECLGKKQEDLSYWQSIKSVYSDMFSVKNDPCAEYHANFLISPHLKVTPTKVVAVTLTRFAVEPMEHIGTAFSKAFKNMFSGLPITLWIPAFLFVLLVILGFLLIVAVCFGYNFSFNLPFWAGLQFGPQQAVHHNPEMDRVLDDNRRHIDQLHETIRELRERPQQQALPAPTVSPSRSNGILGYLGIGRRSNSPPPQERPAPPPYPAQETRESNLPYPEYEPPHFPESAPVGSGVRRRNTIPRTMPNMTYGGGDNPLPYPSGPAKPRSSSTSQLPRNERTPLSQNPIGFEHLLEDIDDEDRGLEDPPATPKQRNSSTIQATNNQRIARNQIPMGVQQLREDTRSDEDTHESKASPIVSNPDLSEQSRRTTVSLPVQEFPVHASGDATSTAPKVPHNASPGTKPCPQRQAKATPDSFMRGERRRIETPGTGNDNETLPAEDSIPAGNNDSATENLEDWEQVSAEEQAESCVDADEKLNTTEWQAIYEREALEGFKSEEEK